MFLGIPRFQKGVLLFQSKDNNFLLFILVSMIGFYHFVGMSKIPKSLFHTLKIENPKEYVYNVQLNRPEKANAMNGPMWL